MSQTTSDPLVGATMAHYEILAKLGGGGMGVVYAARDQKLGRRVALKFLPPQWSHDESAKQRFIREAQAASATDHPNICTIHDIDTAPDGRLFIVMAQYDGPTLKERLEQGPLRPDEAIDVAAQIAEGLARAHGQGVVHRDVKPGNLILTEDGVRIVDFGLARFAGSLQLTLEGSTLGTVAYMSPEQSRGDDADTRSDVWSIGVVLFEMLSGELPFKGGYAEMIANDIRTKPTPPLPVHDGAHLEPVERVVRRALEKDPAQRYQNAREMARDLRLLQGRTLPLDLRTEPLPLIPPRPSRVRRRRLRALIGAASAGVLAVGAVGAWVVLSPPDRIPIAIAPVLNQTGYAELEPYRMALTHALTTQLADSPLFRVLPYDSLLQTLRRFRAPGADVSSREALSAIAAAGHSSLIVVPTLLYENGAWRARAELRDPASATATDQIETPAVVSSLFKDTAYGLTRNLSSLIVGHVSDRASWRTNLAFALRRALGVRVSTPSPGLSSLDAQQAFESGLDAYSRLEYSAAMRSFATAVEVDARYPLAQAWLSRTALLMRQDKMAVEAGDRALQLAAAGIPAADGFFITAVAAEAHRNFTDAGAAYRAWAAAEPADVPAALELAAYQDRTNDTRASIETYRRALTLTSSLSRPLVDLCRLYNRLNESASARQEGERALTAARSAGDWSTEAQALFCLTDTYRTGTPADRAEASKYADTAVALLRTNSAGYQVGRGLYYQGVAAYANGNMTAALASWRDALEATKQEGNLLLEPLLLMNMGVVLERLDQNTRAADYYQDSYRAYERLGEEARAAQVQANRGALLIEYGDRPDEGQKDVENALAVVRKLGDKNFEVFCLQVIAARQRYAGRHDEAVRTLNQALAISRERDLKDDVSSLTLDIARSRFELGDYAGARRLLQDALADGSGPRAAEARIRLSQTLFRLRDAAAENTLSELPQIVDQNKASRALVALGHLVLGQAAYSGARLDDARREFTRAAATWNDLSPDASALEANISLAALDLEQGRRSQARSRLESALPASLRMGRYGLELRTRVLLARIALADGRTADGASILQPLRDAANRTAGPELEATLAKVRHDISERQAQGDR